MTIRFLTLALTRADEKHACVGALAENGCWVRPEVIALSDVEGPGSPYQYFHWTEAIVAPSQAADSRPEDLLLVPDRDAPRLHSCIPAAERLQFLINHVDADVVSALSAQRSLGLIEATVESIYLKRSTAARDFIRLRFIDASHTAYDWIVPELAFLRLLAVYVSNGELSPQIASELVAILRSVRTFLAIALTKPNWRFPGRLRGCHPLIVGVHTEPHYAGLLARRLSP